MKMNKKTRVVMGIAGVLFILLSGLTFASASSTIKCIDDNTLQKIKSKLICDDLDCSILNITENETCPYGCSSTELTCKPTPFNQNLFFLGIILFFVIAIAVITHLKR